MEWRFPCQKIMKNVQQHLIRLGALMGAKYASIDANIIKNDVKDAIWTAIANASAGHQGIIPFIKMLQADDASMNINITRNDNTVTVSAPSLDKPELANKYVALPNEIKTYLERYLDLFPSQRNGQPVDYNNFTIMLTYPNQ